MDELLPDEILVLINSMIEEVNTSQTHQLNPQRRIQLYEILRNISDIYGERTCIWLAILTAKRVLPIFQNEFPDDPLPQDMIDAAINILENRIDDAEAYRIQDEGYNASGNSWGYDESEISWRADLAGRSAYSALKEARGEKPLRNLEKFFTMGQIDFPSGENVNGIKEPISASEFTDEELCQIEPSDAASSAAVASSCRVDGPICEPKKMKEFWNWWLMEAIPEAWVISHREERPTRA